MKAMILFLCMATLGGCAILNPPAEGTDCIFIPEDVTEPQSEDYILIENLIPYLPVLNAQSLRGAKVVVTELSDLHLNIEHTILLQATDGMNSNTITRASKINEFREHLDSVLKRTQRERPGRDRSEVFSGIAHSANKLAQCQECETRTLIIASDLFENTELFSVYDSQLLMELERDSDMVEELIPIEADLSGIEIYLVHRTSRKDDRRFNIVSKIVSTYLSSKGARVHIVAALPTTP